MSLLAAQASAASFGQIPGPLELQLCPITPAVVGIPSRIVWDDIGLPTEASYTYEAAGPGTADANGWLWTPDVEGTRVLTVRQYLDGELVARVSTRLIVLPAEAPGSPAVVYQTYGDSITATAAADAYTNVLSRLLTAGGVDWTSLGTQQQASADAGVYHEGYSGRTARWLAGLDVDGGSQTPHYETGGPSPVSRLPTYIATDLGATPTLVHYQLPGPNDSNAYGGAPEGMGAYHDSIIAALEQDIADFKAAAPGLLVTIGTIFGMSSSVADFASQAAWDEWRVKRHSLLKKVIAAFKGREAEGIFLSATHHAVRPYTGNNVHPPVTPGHTDIANAIYCGFRRAIA